MRYFFTLINAFLYMTLAQKMEDAEKELRARGHEIFLPEFTRDYAQMSHPEERHRESASNKIKYNLIKQYFDKINKSDAIFVINEERHGITNYIGGNSFLEMGFAYVLGKKIFLQNPIPNMLYADEIITMQPIVINGNYDLII